MANQEDKAEFEKAWKETRKGYAEHLQRVTKKDTDEILAESARYADEIVGKLK